MIVQRTTGKNVFWTCHAFVIHNNTHTLFPPGQNWIFQQVHTPSHSSRANTEILKFIYFILLTIKQKKTFVCVLLMQPNILKQKEKIFLKI